MKSMTLDLGTLPQRSTTARILAVFKVKTRGLLVAMLVLLGVYATPDSAYAQCDEHSGCGSVGGEAVSCDGFCFEALGNLVEDVWDWLFGTEPDPTPEQVAAENAAKRVKDTIDKFHEDAMAEAPVVGEELGTQWQDEAAVQPEIVPGTGAASRSGKVKAPTLQGEISPPVDGSMVRALADDFGSVEADTDPIALRKGEFILNETDHEFEGAEPQLRLVRHYRSRVNFKANLGPGWDHNLNPRIFKNRSEGGCEEEVVVSLGDLNPIPMKPTAADSKTYEAALGASSVRLKWQQDLERKCVWQLTLPNAYQYCFTPGGFASKVTAPNGGKLEFEWSNLTDEDTARVLKVRRYLKGRPDATHTLSFSYSGSRLDSVQLEGDEANTRVSYKYNGLGQLERVEDWSCPDLADRFDCLV